MMHSKNIIEKTQNHISVGVRVLILKEDDLFVAYCPALELSSYGKNIEEAKDNFKDALQIFINETHKRGTLERALLSLGWTLKQKPQVNYKPPELVGKIGKLSNLITSQITQEVQLPV
jgi:predicted RNase H-like HicB family nuclease